VIAVRNPHLDLPGVRSAHLRKGIGVDRRHLLCRCAATPL
jgi:hypothetical protein